ncbi:NAD(P)H-dependent oxidoreductase [Nakamurella sp. A5-74]|uniref:NAD(P)H-dependent oxidoreductase n=1 Tax=Nakamurella sp. A5-74 TaxID=3158264 RepID=A0AAU8DQI1_9ACTN
MADPDLTALVLVCSLKASPARSSSELLGTQLLAAMAPHGVTGRVIRVLDHDVKPGVETDMGDGDEWPAIRTAILASDILVIATPTWMGQHSSVCMRVLERLDAELSELDDEGRPQVYPRVAALAVVGNEDGAHHVSADVFQALDDVGFTLPAQAVTYWNGAAMHKTDYQDLDETPEETAAATKLVATNTAHLARVLRDHPYPPVG